MRVLNPYEKNQLLKYDLSLNLPDSDHTPVEYLTGHVEFCGHDFLVDHHTLIPRLETQEIIDPAVSHLKSRILDLKSPDIVDIGTGSGALGISLSLALTALPLPHTLYLSDISSAALQVARENAQRLLPPHQSLKIIKSHLFANFPPIKFDLLTANLPYIPSARIKTLDPSVKDFEPHTALDGGSDGAQIINQFLEALDRFAASSSLTILEIDHTHQLSHFRIPAGFTPRFLNDSFGRRRFLLLTAPKKIY